MNPEKYLDLKQFVIDQGYAEDIDFYDSEKILNADKFALEAGYVIVNSGMKNQIADQIWPKIRKCLRNGYEIYLIFGHKGKAEAIQSIWDNRKTLFARYLAQKDNAYRLIELEKLPWIGPITKYHLAKNLGIDVCKPDRHLVRIAEKYNTTPEKLCKELSDATGDRIATVDYVIWRAANLGEI